MGAKSGKKQNKEKKGTPDNRPPSSGGNVVILLHTQIPTVPARPKKTGLKMMEFKVYIDLYKFFLKLCLSVNVFYLGLLGGFLTFLFRPTDKKPDALLTFVFPLTGNGDEERLIDTLNYPVKEVLLVTPFLIGYVLMLSFAMGGVYWLISTRQINRHINKKPSESKNNEVELITTPFFHLLTFLLFAVAIIFMLVTYVLGIIMEKYKILFYEGSYMPRASLEYIFIVSLILSLVPAIRYGKKAANEF